jgi:hypothetical protein
MNHNQIVLAPRTENRRAIGKQRQLIGRLAFKYRQQITAVFTTLFAIFQPKVAKADSIFSSAQNAMKCIVNYASSGGTSNALLQNLPVILFTSLNLVIFGYFIYTVVQSVSSYGRGEEVTHVVQQPLFTFVFIIIIYVFQTLMFGSGGSC